jgi:hypothetical protein
MKVSSKIFFALKSKEEAVSGFALKISTWRTDLAKLYGGLKISPRFLADQAKI